MADGNHTHAPIVGSGVSTRILLLVVAALALIGAACGDSDDSGDTPSGPLTVEEVVDRSPDGVVTVNGFLLVDESGPRLCAAILESFPPQCGEPAIFLVDLDVSSVGNTQSEQGVVWREDVTLTVQQVDDRTYRVVQG